MSLDQTNNTDNSLYPKQKIEDEDDDSWQVSYLDIITILLGFLIILLSFSDLNNGEPFSVSELFKSSINESEFITTPIDNIKEELESLLEPEIQQGKLEIFRELNDVRIRFKSDDLYNSGKAELEDEASVILNRVLEAFKLISYNDFEIDVEGHTDNVPISTSNFESNWELSTARASNIVKYFSNMGIEQERLKASGYADSRPLVEFDQEGNPYPASKDKNRRVVLRLFYSGVPERTASIDSTIVQNKEAEAIDTVAIATQYEPETDETEMDEIEADEEPIVSNEIEELTDDTKTEAELNPVTETPANEESSNQVTQEIKPQKPPTRQETSPTSVGNFENGCRYSVQVGGFESFSNSLNYAEQAEERTGFEFEILYNNSLFSIRTKSQKSLLETISLQRTIEENFDENQLVGFVQQCYDNGRERPQPLKYQIQLGFFQSEQNAISFKETILNEHNIESIIEQKSLQAYTVSTLSLSSIKTAQQRLERFKNLEGLEAAFIKFDPNSVVEYSFSYQIQLGSFATKQEVDILANRLREELNVQSSIKTLNDGRYYLVTRPFSNWNEVTDLYSTLVQDSSDLFPVIYLNERI